MVPASSTEPGGVILLIGASRGLGHAMAAEFLKKGWNVVGTVRGGGTPLHALAEAFPGRVEIEILDISEADQIAAMKTRLSGRTFEILFVNAGTTNNDPTDTISDVSTDEFVQVMVTNALSPMRVIDSFAPFVSPTGVIGVMSSGQGSIANNETGLRELYRGSKAALNMFMRSFAARQTETSRAMVVLAPGWIRTDLGGPTAPYTLEESVPDVVATLLAKRGKPGLEYLDRFGHTVPW